VTFIGIHLIPSDAVFLLCSMLGYYCLWDKCCLSDLIIWIFTPLL